MLSLSELLLKESDNISNFEELKSCIQKTAIETRELHFQVDIEPPAYDDRPSDWHDQLNLAFESAR
ncbi:hypothetical protein GCM10009133_20330 [Cocleimonas flava]|jgi:hypothetical protein|uniref:Sulfur relay protein DsrC n=1 Tax=Cocleimonas flava TaxID=634765 RepID=A0A4R1ETJ3_9GAMM|nr:MULTISPECIES: hypothetical protein [Cocleimonas]MEB8433725.1 hypothetical protein [Cocleimonas sp. KMM 6892]MEC4716536.1 hypothetical protein [Cocleimonas sp. KMM 6895]MEC4746309.1 hypothetical protein [Cocleimonas sp. KMM 6896]TCJ84956.1 hypothetical protein EV695_2919 [Cocleimonas flava]